MTGQREWTRGSALPGRTSRVRDERGAAMVEFALVLPIFLALLFGIISYGWMLSYRQSISQAAAEGARVLAVAPQGASGLDERAGAAVNRSLASYGVSCEDGVMLHKGQAVGTCTIPVAGVPCPPPNPAPGADCATVTLSHSYRDHPLIPSFPGLGITLPEELTFASTVEMN